jgi:hypothetical protein
LRSLPSLSPSPSPSAAPPTKAELVAHIVAAIKEFSNHLNDPNSIGTKEDILVCSVDQMRLKLQLAELGNVLDNLTSTAIEWRQLSDYKVRLIERLIYLIVFQTQYLARRISQQPSLGDPII